MSHGSGIAAARRVHNKAAAASLPKTKSFSDMPAAATTGIGVGALGRTASGRTLKATRSANSLVGGGSGSLPGPSVLDHEMLAEEVARRAKIKGRQAMEAELEEKDLLKSKSTYQLYKGASEGFIHSSAEELKQVIDLMAKDVDDETAVTKAVVVLSQIAAKSNANKWGHTYTTDFNARSQSEANAAISRLGGIDVLVLAMRKHMMSKRVILKSVWALEHLLEENENRSRFREQEGFKVLQEVRRNWKGNKDIKESLKKIDPEGESCCVIM